MLQYPLTAALSAAIASFLSGAAARRRTAVRGLACWIPAMSPARRSLGRDRSRRRTSGLRVAIAPTSALPSASSWITQLLWSAWRHRVRAAPLALASRTWARSRALGNCRAMSCSVEDSKWHRLCPRHRVGHPGVSESIHGGPRNTKARPGFLPRAGRHSIPPPPRALPGLSRAATQPLPPQAITSAAQQ